MATTAVTPTYLFPYPTGEDSLSNVAQRIQDLAERIEQTYATMGIDGSFTNLMQNGDAAGGSLTGTYPNPTIAVNAIDNTMLQDNTVSTNEIVDQAVTSAKIANDVNLNGSPTTTTQNLLDTSTKIATTAFVNGVAANFVLGVLSPGSVTSDMLADQSYIDFATLSPAALQEGRLTWDDTEGVLTMGIKGNPVPLYIGEQVMDRVTNVQGSTIGKLKAVYPFGSSGNRMTVKLALADSDPTSSRTFGVTTASIADNQAGFTISQGLIKDVDTSGLTEGAAVWLSASTAGELTTTKPVAPNHLVLIGFCIRQHAVNGILLVKVVNGFELDELHDVRITSPANTEILQYDSTIPSWKNISVASAIPASTITSSMIVDGTIVNGDINASAGIVYSKLSLGNSIVNADVASAAAIAYSKLNLSGSVVAGDMSSTYPGHYVAANAAARPASPTIGQMVYQTDADDLISWVTDLDATNRWMMTEHVPYRNALINGDFKIWQRGTTFNPTSATSTTGANYGADRWQMLQATNNTSNAFVRTATTSTDPAGYTYYTRVQRTNALTFVTPFTLQQSIESVAVRPFQGRFVTLSFWARAGANYSAASSYLVSNIVTGTGTDNTVGNFTTNTVNTTTNNVLTTSWKRFVITTSATIGSTITQLGVSFVFTPVGTAGAADYFDITGIQLEPYCAPSEYEFREFADELQRCQRFYYRMGPYASGTQRFGNGYNGTTTAANVYISFPVTLRSAPTALETSGTPGNYAVANLATTTAVTTGPTFSSATTDGSMVVFTTTTAMTAGQAVQGINNSTTTAYLGWSAEL